MEKQGNHIAKIAIILGIISLLVSIYAHYQGELMSVGYKGWIASSAVMFLMATALNTLKK